MTPTVSTLSKAFNFLAPGRVQKLNAQLLQYAADPGKLTAANFEALLQQGADINVTDKHGNTALNLLCAQEDPIALTLIRFGADYKKANDAGMTPFLSAAAAGSAPILEALIAAGADPHQTTPKGENALLLLVNVPSDGIIAPYRRTRRREALEVLVATDIQPDNYVKKRIYSHMTFLLPAVPQIAAVHALAEAAAQGNTAEAIALMKQGVSPDAPEAFGDAGVLASAAKLGDAGLAGAAIDAGAKINAPSRGIFGATPLQIAAFFGQREVFLCLLDAGADWRAQITVPTFQSQSLPAIAQQGGVPGMMGFVANALHERSDVSMTLGKNLRVKPIRLKKSPDAPA
jgi:ankyrin repeat protein